jgi:hypothetical protein
VSERRDEMETAGQATVGATAVAVAGVEDDELLVRCNCHTHVGWLHVDRDSFDEGPSAWFTIASVYPDSRITGELRERLKAVWLILRGRRHWFEEIVLVPDDAERVGRFLLAAFDTGDPQGAPPKDGSPAPPAPEREEV